ncbi:MAG TPA: hypothetical protein VG477_07765 [Thermoanaerobaculia bacterium]|nr:hypothetical protein [Thermoanaerobaculia bacterium]
MSQPLQQGPDYLVGRGEIERIQGYGEAELDQLPFGAIRLDREGTILSFNQAESDLSGRMFPYVFDYKMDPRKVWVTLFYSNETDTAWVFVRDDRKLSRPE